MARRAANNADTGEASAAIVAQRRIYQLKRERDKKINDIASKAIKNLNEIKHRISQQRAKEQKKRKQERAATITKIAKSIQKRNTIEGAMMEAVTQMHRVMEETEDLVLEAHDSKEHRIQEQLEENLPAKLYGRSDHM